MSERGLAHGGLSDYYSTWYMFADRKGTLLISEPIPWSQRSDPTRLSATEVSLQYLYTCTYCPAHAYQVLNRAMARMVLFFARAHWHLLPSSQYPRVVDRMPLQWMLIHAARFAAFL